ncbi:4Fe-4S binding protein [Wukongibacter baidiensis]|uniref:4Fe-4S binding protein n=1 Tax=Wukongibacter baidiensis TaxID=1723361 RepID=UPI003D7FD95C
MAKGKPVVDYKTCMACGICIQACPFSCLDSVKTDVDKYKKAYPYLVDKQRCTSCGLCDKACPVSAITLV